MTTVDTATNPGAEQRTDEEGAQRPKSARETMMEQIDGRHEQALSGQIHQQAPLSADMEETVLVDDPKRFKLRVKIGDREEERSLDTVMNELQSSQGRLRSLSQRERDLQAALAEKERLLEQQLVAQLAAPETTDDEINARVSEVMNALVEGDEEKGAAALREVLKKGRQAATPIDEKQLVGRVKAELVREQEQTQAAEVWESFVAEHPEFSDQVNSETGNPVLSEERQYGDYVFVRDFEKRVKTGEISYQQALNETAEKVRTVFAKERSTVPQKSEIEKRQERKKQLDQLPVAAGARADTAPGEAGESRADIIAQMRKARGLPA
jgi:hypothetical protein